MSIEAMKQALEALEEVKSWKSPTRWDGCFDEEITSLRQAIEQAEKQEPVAWMIWTHGPVLVFMNKDEATMEFERLNTAYPEQSRKLRPLYTTPQPQEFVCSTGLCHFTLTQTNVGIGERGMEAYEAAKERGWVGVSDERLMEMPKQEPVALETVYETIIHWDEGGGKRSRRELARRIVDLYTTPPHRKPLSDEEIDAIYTGVRVVHHEIDSYVFARAIEQAHGIKE
jgi:hypothetical protein